MKRKGNIYQNMISIENLQIAYSIAIQGKSKQKGVIKFNENLENNLFELHIELKNKTYKTAEYKHFILHDPKKRKISSLPFKDRVVHHLIMMQLEKIFVSAFTTDTYSCIKGKGIHAAKKALTKQLQSIKEDVFCFKGDVKQFYPSINHDILKSLLRRKIKDYELLELLDEIIDSAAGVPIGNYLSQYFANFYLCYLDHFIKETLGVKNYCRYADDIVIIDSDINYLHTVRVLIQEYLWCELKLELKENYQVFPVKDKNGRGIDFVGYVQYKTHIKLRKSIKKRFAKMIARRKNKASIASYYGWAKGCNSLNLLHKLLHDNIQRIRN